MLEEHWIEEELKPPELAPAQWTWHRAQVGLLELWLVAPSDPDRLLGDPGTLRASDEADYMPYWAYSWSSSEALARWLVARPELVRGHRVLELGCGLGLVGLVAAALGARVTVNDHSRAALAAVSASARRNGLRVRALCFDWRRPPQEPQFPVVLAADVLYEPHYPQLVASCLDRLLTESGVAYLVDPCRFTADRFPDELRQHGLAAEVHDLEPIGNYRHRLFQVWRRNSRHGR